MIKSANKFLSIIIIIMMLVSTGFNAIPVVTAESISTPSAEETIPEAVAPEPVAADPVPTEIIATEEALDPAPTLEETQFSEVPAEADLPAPVVNIVQQETQATELVTEAATVEPQETPMPESTEVLLQQVQGEKISEFQQIGTPEKTIIPEPSSTPLPVETEKGEEELTATPEPTEEASEVVQRIIQPVEAVQVYKFFVGTSLVDEQRIKSGEHLTQPASPEAGVCSQFLGWYIDGQTSPVDFGQAVSFTNSASFDVRAKIENLCYVYFVYAGNVITTKTVAPSGTVDGSNVSLVIKESGKAFSHWSLVADGAAYNFGTPVNSNLTLYAVLTDKYKVSFDTLGGSTQLPVYVLAGGNLASQNVPAPTKVGYTFARWSLTAGGAAYDQSSTINADIQLFAVWAPKTDTPYTVNYFTENANDNGYSFHSTETRYGTTGALISFAAPALNGFAHSQTLPVGATISGDGTTKVNAYYTRNRYTLIMKVCTDYYWGGCDTYTEVVNQSVKQGASTAQWWAPIVEANPTANFGKNSSGAGPWYSWPPIMENANMTIYGMKKGDTKYRIFYLENVTGNPQVHAPYNFTGDSGLSLTEEDYVNFPGFERIEPDNGWRQPATWDNNLKVWVWKIYYNRLSFRITFNKNDGTGTTTTSPIPYQADISNKALSGYTPNDTIKTIDGVNYLFAGWWDNQIFDGAAYSFTGKTMPANNLVLYGKWVPPVHNVTVHVLPGGGSATNVTVVDHGALFAQSTADGVRQTPSGLSYPADFVGWFWYVNGTFAKFDFAMPITADVEIFPVWKDLFYTVTYNLNGGTGSVVDSNQYTLNSSANVLSGEGITPPTGMVFIGWKDSNNQVFGAGESLTITGNMTLTAQYAPVNTNTKITYKANGGTGADKSFDLANNATHTAITLAAAGFARSGYFFKGWSTTPTDTGSYIQPNTDVLVDRVDEASNVLYAIWAAVPTGPVVATKEWVGGKKSDWFAPVLNLYRKIGTGTGELVTTSATATITETPPNSGKYTYTWANLPLKSAATFQDYIYYVTEPQLNMSKYLSTVTNNLTVTNTYNATQGQINAMKSWSGTETFPICLTLTGRSEAGSVVLYPVILDGVPNTDPSKIGNEDSPWEAKWTGLPATDELKYAYTYTLTETRVVNGACTTEPIPNYETTITVISNNQNQTVYQISNVFVSPKLDVKVTKNWAPADLTTDLKVPVKVKLFRYSVTPTTPVQVGAEVELNAGNNWTYTWTNLDQKDPNNKTYIYSVVESPVPADFDVSYAPATVTDKLISLEVTNTYRAATLKLVKALDLTYGGSANVMAWTLTATGPLKTLSGTSGVTGRMPTGTYTLAESGGPDGFDMMGWVCTGKTVGEGNTITLAKGDDVTCTVTNKGRQATLILIKAIDNTNGGTSTYSDWTLKAVGLTEHSGKPADEKGISFNVNAGNYALSESADPDLMAQYQQGDWVCVGGSQSGLTVNLLNGETATCTITNTAKPIRLTLVKNLQNNYGGPAVLGDWTLTATSSTNTYGGKADSPSIVNMSVMPGSYVLSEQGPTDHLGLYDNGQFVCTGGSFTSGTQTLVLKNGDAATCTVTNTDKPAYLTLVKIVKNPYGGTSVVTDWTLTATGPTTGLTGKTNDPAITNKAVSAGTYKLAESAAADILANYNASEWACNAGSYNALTDELTLTNGQAATCTITNTDKPATLTLVKKVANSYGGTSTISDWTLTATGPTPEISGVTNSPAVTGKLVSAGSYILSESADADIMAKYAASEWSCTAGSYDAETDTLTLTNGQSATCTITNQDLAAKLTLMKWVTNNYGGTSKPSDWTLTAVGPVSEHTGLTDEPSITNVLVSAGAYKLSETAPDSIKQYYEAEEWVCTDGDYNAEKDEITITNGQNVTCVIINTDKPALLTLVKEVVNDNGGTATPSDWTLLAKQGTQTILSGQTATAAVTVVEVSAGSYALSEEGGPSGYTASSWVCQGGTQTNNNIALKNGESAVCTITNNDQPAKLTLVKTVTNDDGGKALPGAWTLNAQGPSPLSGTTPVSGAVNAGLYTLSETNGPTGYAAGDWACVLTGTTTPVNVTNSQVNLTVGQDVTCTINNNDTAATLTLVKKVENPYGGTSTVADWTLSATGSFEGATTGISGVTGDSTITNRLISAGSYTLAETASEALLAQYAMGDWTCDVNGVLSGTTLTIGNGQDVECTITNTAKPALLTLVKTVNNRYGGTALVSDWTLNAQTGSTTYGGQGGSADVVEMPVPAGSYVLSETGLDKYLNQYGTNGFVCEGGIFTQSTQTLVLENGDDVTCTIENFDLPAKLTLIKLVVDGPATDQDWRLSADCGVEQPCGTYSISGKTPVSSDVVPAGKFVLAEAVEPVGADLPFEDYSPSDWVCVLTGTTTAVALTGTDLNELSLTNGQDVSCTITNTYSSPTPDLLATKRWVNGAAADYHAVEIAVYQDEQLMTDGYSYTVDPTADGQASYTYTISGLPTYHKDGTTAYRYLIREVLNDVVLEDGELYGEYTVSYDDTNRVITNTYYSPLTEITANKVWAPENLQESLKVPVEFRLYRYTTDINDALPVGDPQTLDAPEWSATWTDLEITDPYKVDYIYFVRETETPDNFTADPVDDLTITNTYSSPNELGFMATKVWSGGYPADHIAVPLTLWRQIEGGPMQVVEAMPTISPDPASVPTSDSYTYTWTELLNTDPTGAPYSYYVTEEIYKYYERQYSTSITVGGVEYCGGAEPTCVVANIAPNPAAAVMTGEKVWEYGPATKPTVWLQLMQSENGAAAKPYLAPVMLDGSADAGCLSGCENSPWKAVWLNVPTTDNMEKTWTYYVKEVDANGADFTPNNYNKRELGMTVTNTFVPPTLIDPPIGFKVWQNYSGPYPTVWMHLYRQVNGGAAEAVGSPVPLDGTPGGDCNTGCETAAWQARWDGLKATDLYGNTYTYFVKETDANGVDWKPDQFEKVESGMTVTNIYQAPQPQPTPRPSVTPVVTIPYTGDSSSMMAYGLFALASLLAFGSLQAFSLKRRKK